MKWFVIECLLSTLTWRRMVLVLVRQMVLVLVRQMVLLLVRHMVLIRK